MFVQDGEPNFNRVEPARVLGRVDEADAMLGITQIGLSGFHALENAPFAFFTEDLIVTERLSDEVHERLALMGIELITQDDKVCQGIGLDQSLDVFNKVGFGPRMSNRRGDEVASRKVQISSQDLGAMPDVVELSAFHFACLGWQGCPISLQSLDAWFFVNADRVEACGFMLVEGCGVQFTDLLYLLCKLVPVSNVGMFPVSAAMRLEGGLLLKNARFGLLRCS